MSTQFSFPANPNVGDTFTMPNGIVAQWNGTEWVSAGDSTSTVTYPLPITLGGTAAGAAPQARINLGLNAATGEFIVQKDGTAALPGIAFASEPGMGWYRSAANNRAYVVGGFEIESLAGSATTTSLVLHPRAAGNSSVVLATKPGGVTPYEVLNLNMASAGGTLSVTNSAGTRLPIFMTSSRVSTLDSLEVHADAGVNAFLTLDKKAGGLNGIYGNAGGLNRWQIQPGDGIAETGSNLGSNFGIYRYDDGGNLIAGGPAFGIARNSGNVNFSGSVTASSYVTTNLVQWTSGGTINLGSTSFPSVQFDTTGYAFIFVKSSGDLVWQRPGSPTLNLMTISSAGGNLSMAGNITANVGFVWPAGGGGWGLTSTGYRASAPLQVADVFNVSSIGTNAMLQAVQNPGVASTFQFTIGGGGASFIMDGSGQGRSPGGWTTGTCDIRVKDNLRPIENAMAMVRKWCGYTYDKMDCVGEDGVVPRKAGLIAQDLADDLPEAVPMYGGFHHMDLNAPVAVLTNAMKELDQRLAALEAS